MKKALSIFLSALLLISSTSFTVSNHFCKGSLEKVKIGFSAENLACKMMKSEISCEQHPSQKKMKRAHCCSNQYVHFSLNDTYEKVSPKKAEIDLNFFLAYSFVNAGFDPFVKEKDHTFLFYSPPALDRDIPILIQSFLI